MLKKDIVNGLFVRDHKYVFTVFADENPESNGKYSLICLNKHIVIESYALLQDLKLELACGYTLVGRFEELDVESLIQEKTLHEETY